LIVEAILSRRIGKFGDVGWGHGQFRCGNLLGFRSLGMWQGRLLIRRRQRKHQQRQEEDEDDCGRFRKCHAVAPFIASFRRRSDGKNKSR
jgi:hypothetical protein